MEKTFESASHNADASSLSKFLELMSDCLISDNEKKCDIDSVKVSRYVLLRIKNIKGLAKRLRKIKSFINNRQAKLFDYGRGKGYLELFIDYELKQEELDKITKYLNDSLKQYYNSAIDYAYWNNPSTYLTIKK